MAASSSDPAASPATLSQLLAVRPYVWFWSGRVLANLAIQIQSVALAWEVYATARRTETVNQAAFAVGMLGLAQFLPMVALSLFAGDAADRYDRRTIMAFSLAAQLAAAICFGLLAWSGPPSLWPIYVLGAAFGAARAFYAPASTALAPTLVERSLLPRSIVFNSAGGQLGAILGPAVGGVTVALSPVLAFSLAGALVLGSLAALLGFRAPSATTGPVASRVALIGEGLRYVWANKIVLGAISLDLFAVLLGGATALLPVFARDVLHVGPQGFGVLRAAPSAGALLIGLVLATRPVRSKVGLKMFLAVGVYGLATAVFALSRSMVVSALALAALGAGDMVSVFVRQSLVQIVTPNAMRGRVAAVSTLFIGASNELGEFESGGMARLLGPVGSALFGGFGALAVTVLWAWMFPALRKADTLE